MSSVNRRRQWNWRSRACCGLPASTRLAFTTWPEFWKRRVTVCRPRWSPTCPGSPPASRALRRDRELAFSGAEDLTPSEFYRREDADEARAAARFVVERVGPHVLGQ